MISKPDKTGVYHKYGAEMDYMKNVSGIERHRIKRHRIKRLSDWNFNVFVVRAEETVIKAIENMKKGVKS